MRWLVVLLCACSSGPPHAPMPAVTLTRPPLALIVAMAPPASPDDARTEPALLPPRPPARRPTLPTVNHGVADYFLSNVFAEPSLAASIVGFIQTGVELALGPAVTGQSRHCPMGWHPLADGRGYMCGGKGLNPGRRARPTRRGTAIARLDELVPYRYAYIYAAGTPLYKRRPSYEEHSAKESLGPAAVDGDLVVDWLDRGFMVSVRGVSGRQPETYWSRLRGGYVSFEHGYNLRPRPFQGAEIRDASDLPLGFVTGFSPGRYRRQGEDLIRVGDAARLSRLRALREETVGQIAVVATGDGELYLRDDVSIVRLPPRPPDLMEAERWAHVSLTEQTLVALEGLRPVYATVVSTGLDIPGRRTRPGSFHVQSKHVSATMDRDNVGDSYSIEDVPWTMFYDRSFALHGAFWHERFGHRLSHGCVNLSAADARWLFRWVGPELPTGWYGVLSTPDNPGSRIVIE